MNSGAPMLSGLVRHHLADPRCSFSIGSYGAIGEFHRRADEPIEFSHDGPQCAVTPRGAIRIGVPSHVTIRAYETLTRRAWQQGVLVCLPQAAAKGAERKTLTELGADHDAIRPCDHEAVLFDMGLDTPNVDFCVRTSDAALIDVLRAHAGRSVLDPASVVMPAILDANPHRVVMSSLGRVEVYQAIGRTRTPEGPHTHVLPKLLASRRSVSANVSVPEGQLPCLSLYPSHPALTTNGKLRDFDVDAHAAFQALLTRFGADAYTAEKRRLEHAVAAGVEPEDFALPVNRLGRTAVRVALRQLRAAADGDQARVSRWIERFDRAQTPEADGDQELLDC